MLCLVVGSASLWTWRRRALAPSWGQGLTLHCLEAKPISRELPQKSQILRELIARKRDFFCEQGRSMLINLCLDTAHCAILLDNGAVA